MNLHNEIMNIIEKRPDSSFENTHDRVLYKEGHRDARHAAAELSLQTEQDKLDAQRYRAWRDCVLSGNLEFIGSIQNNLPSDTVDIELDRTPTAAEWDAAIDFAIEECLKC